MEAIEKALETGMLDLLCILSHNEVVKYGIPFLGSIFEKDCSAKELESWNKFWNYFVRQQIPILDRWNIANKENDDSHFDVVNRTNNGLERYNRHFNGLFIKKPLLLEFVQIVEEESRAQDQKLSNIKYGKKRELEREEQTIPDIPPGYFTYKNAK